ncbi:probable steroid-binding protein 3 [Triticum urartu]|uniref:probable steroid-binding protein 3 n=1 Tax=Triticum urartu TaxID=4572 RepID=UPI00204361DE|nr:probable steroid-binding protein 3 [Triticum urartu]
MATELTAAQLRAYDGTDASKPIYVAIRGKVFDVSAGRGFYGPGGDYALFAGCEAARALAKMSKDAADVSGDLSGLSDKELGVLADWESKFQAKYPVVARLAA